MATAHRPHGLTERLPLNGQRRCFTTTLIGLSTRSTLRRITDLDTLVSPVPAMGQP